MSLLKDTIAELASEGTISVEVPIGKSKFKLEVLSTEEQILADSIIRNKTLREKYGANETDITTFQDTLAKYRTISILCFAIRSIDGIEPIDKSLNTKDQFDQRMEFRDELGTLKTPVIDKLMMEYQKISEEQRKFFNDVIENAGK